MAGSRVVLKSTITKNHDGDPNHNYLLEKFDPLHRFGGDLNILFEHYVKYIPQTKGFFDWVSGLTNSQLQAHLGLKNHEIAGFRKGVTYLDDKSRVSYQLFFEGGLILKSNRTPFDTTSFQTHDDVGMAIFVLSPEGEFYASQGSIEIGKFHHSSFLSGAPVLAAGDMQVLKGKLIQLTACSGHYKPKTVHLKEAVAALGAKGIAPNSYNVEVKDKREKDPKKSVKLVSAQEFLWGGGAYFVPGDDEALNRY